MPVAASITVVASGTTDVAGLAAAAGRRLLGFSIQEDAGAPAVAEAKLRLGTLVSDTEIAFISLAASGAQTVWFGDRGIDASAGVFFERVTGTTVLALYHTTGA